MQRQLILWRHAKSAWDNPPLSDFERDLAPRGLAAAPEMAAWVAGKCPPDAVLCSPAKRTVQTWLALAPMLPPNTPVAFDARLYEAGSLMLMEALQQTPADTRRLLLVGHNPGLEDLTVCLAGRFDRKFATAAVAVLSFQGEWTDLPANTATLEKFRRPAKFKP